MTNSIDSYREQLFKIEKSLRPNLSMGELTTASLTNLQLVSDWVPNVAPPSVWTEASYLLRMLKEGFITQEGKSRRSFYVYLTGRTDSGLTVCKIQPASDSRRDTNLITFNLSGGCIDKLGDTETHLKASLISSDYRGSTYILDVQNTFYPNYINIKVDYSGELERGVSISNKHELQLRRRIKSAFMK